MFAMYKCSNCGATMSQPLDQCPSCHVLLSGVKCQSCQYIGGKTEFINNNNRCPKCGSHVNGIGGTPAQAAKCPKCRSAWNTIYCGHCGHKKWLKIIAFLLIGAASSLVFVMQILDGQPALDFASVVVSLFGLGLLLVGIYFAFKRPH